MNDTALHAALRWFPLVGWARPACPPLTARVAEITALTSEPGPDAAAGAANALNKAALLASDCGMPDLARDLCWQHITAYRQAGRPLAAPQAQRMLGPALNLARLDLRAGKPHDAIRLLDDIYHAVTAGADVVIDGREVPLAGITGTRDERYRLRESVWRQVLTDGIRSRAMTGNWDQAAKFAEDHKGIGSHLMEGRQAAIITLLLNGDLGKARRVLRATTITEPWEEQVSACLAVTCAPPPEQVNALRTAAEQFLGGKTTPEHVVFRTRLGLVLAQLASGNLPGIAVSVTARITGDAIEIADGYAAREILQNHIAAITIEDQNELTGLVTNSGLGSQQLAKELLDPFNQAVRKALTTISETKCQ